MNNFTIQQQENFEATQRLNNEYLKLNGSQNTEESVGFFTKHNKVFQVLAVLFSAIGIYFDLLSLVGIVVSIAIGLAVGVFLEFGKHTLSKGVFNSSLDYVSRYGLIGGSLFIIMLIAILLHIRSINNFTGSMFQTKTNSIYQDEVQLRKDTTKINLELAKALNNGTNRDDIISAGAIKSNNITLLDSKNSKAKDALLRSLEDNKNTLNGILYLLFMSVEFFSLFGIFGMLIIQRNTDKNVKSVVQTSDKLAHLEANVYQALETGMINTTLNKLDNMKVDSVALPSSVSQIDNNKAQIAFDANSSSKVYNSDTSPYNPFYSVNYSKIDTKTLPKVYNSDMAGIPNTTEETENNINCEDDKKEYLDEETKHINLFMFKPNEQEILLAMTENGTLSAHDRLLKKTAVKEELKDNKFISTRMVDKLYQKLEHDLGFIYFKGAYRIKYPLKVAVTNI